MCTSQSIALVILFAASQAVAQNRYVVHFKDKDASPFSVQAPQAFLSARAMARRERQQIGITADDFPVNPSYIVALKQAGADIYFTSRWRNCALVQASSAEVPAMANLPFVAQVELVAPGIKLSSGRAKGFKNRHESGIAAATKAQLEMVGIDAMHDEDVMGDGVAVALFDSGFQGVDTAAPFRHLFDSNRVGLVYDFVRNTTQVYQYDDHGTEVLSVIAASSSSFTGGAFEAAFHLYVTEDITSEFRVEEYNWLFAAERADSAGVDVISSSLGYNLFDDPSMDYSASALDGKTAIVSLAAAEAMKRGIVVVCSAGNEGSNSWGLVTPPADVNGILAVGAVTSAGVRASFSSRGPTADARIKPDVVAMGSGTSVVQPSGANGFVSGTSVAAPIVTSLVIGILQKFKTLSVQEVYHVITSTASNAAKPDNLLGYGIPHYGRIMDALADPISIYPNPVDGGAFRISLRTANQEAEVTVFDLHGRALSQTLVFISTENNPLHVDVSDLAAGTYLIKVKTKDNFKTSRLVKL